MTRSHYLLGALLVLWGIGGCGSSAPGYSVQAGPGDDIGYADNTDVVVVDGTTFIVSGERGGAGCIEFNGQCIDLDAAEREACGETGGQADVVVVDGKVVDVICYPPRDSGIKLDEVAVGTDGTAQVPQNENGSVIIFDETTDGVALEGDIKVDAERVSIIGNGVDKTIIKGNVNIASNNSHIRGVTIDGNVTFEDNSNTATFAFCKIKGNLIVHSNSVSILNCEIFGNVEINGNNTVLVNVGAGANWKVGKAEVCSGNYSFVDDGDFSVLPAERTGDLTCTQ